MLPFAIYEVKQANRKTKAISNLLLRSNVVPSSHHALIKFAFLEKATPVNLFDYSVSRHLIDMHVFYSIHQSYVSLLASTPPAHLRHLANPI